MPRRIKLLKSYHGLHGKKVFLIFHCVFLGYSPSPCSCLCIFLILNNIHPSQRVYSTPEQYWHVWFTLSLKQAHCNWYEHVKKGVELVNTQILFSLLEYALYKNFLEGPQTLPWPRLLHPSASFIHVLNCCCFLSTFALKQCSTADLILLIGFG